MWGLYADDTVLLAEAEGMLQRIVDEFDSVCTRIKLKGNAGKSKVTVFERAKEQTVNFLSLFLSLLVVVDAECVYFTPSVRRKLLFSP